jgi:hypothetical protein
MLHHVDHVLVFDYILWVDGPEGLIEATEHAGGLKLFRRMGN